MRTEPIYNVRTVRIVSMRQQLLIVCAGFIVATGIALDAQWIKLPAPGLPRLPDGKPNLTAPVPRSADGKPDLSGLWQNDGGDRYYNNVLVDLRETDHIQNADDAAGRYRDARGLLRKPSQEP